MRLRTRHRAPTRTDRLVWQAASLLLAYPDEARLDTVEELLGHVGGPAAEMLGRSLTALTALREIDSMSAAVDYVETFDLKRATTLYLTYWTAGDTRNRGAQMLTFAQAYRDAGVSPPGDEAPDYLPVVLEFAATVDPEAGRRLLTEHRVPIEVLRRALADKKSPYADAVAAVCQTLGPATDGDVRRAQRLAAAGPRAEAVGLEPFTLTVPPRRTEGND